MRKERRTCGSQIHTGTFTQQIDCLTALHKCIRLLQDKPPAVCRKRSLPEDALAHTSHYGTDTPAGLCYVPYFTLLQFLNVYTSAGRSSLP